MQRSGMRATWYALHGPCTVVEDETMARMESPGNDPQIYAVYVDNEDIVWLSYFGANAKLRFDPKTEQFTVLTSTNRNASVRQILGQPGTDSCSPTCAGLAGPDFCTGCWRALSSLYYNFLCCNRNHT